MGRRRVLKSYHRHSTTAYLDVSLCLSRLTRAVLIAMCDGQTEDMLTNKLEISLGRSG